MFLLLKSQAIAALFVAHMGLLFDFRVPEEEVAENPQSVSVSIQDTTLKAKRSSSRHTYSDNNSSTEITYEGVIAFTDDEKDIKSISPGGFFKYSKTTFGNRRAIHIESGSNGNLNRTYYVGKNEEAYEPEGREWLADVLPELIATSGIGAEDRVKKVYAKKGTAGVLEAISELNSDYVKSIYFSYLFRQNGLKENDLKTIITQLGDELSSDYEKGKLLQQVNGTFLQNANTANAYITAVSDMSSDYEKAKVLKHILDHTKLSEANYNKVLEAVSDISSDYEKSKILSHLLNKQNVSKADFDKLIQAVSDISSDYEKNNVLSKLLTTNKLSQENFTKVLNAISGISSDYEKGKTFSVLLTTNNLNDELYIQTLKAVGGISSDYEKGRVLIQISKTMPKDKPLVMETYKKTAKTISSDYEYRKVVASIE